MNVICKVHICLSFVGCRCGDEGVDTPQKRKTLLKCHCSYKLNADEMDAVNALEHWTWYHQDDTLEFKLASKELLKARNSAIALVWIRHRRIDTETKIFTVSADPVCVWTHGDLVKCRGTSVFATGIDRPGSKRPSLGMDYHDLD